MMRRREFLCATAAVCVSGTGFARPIPAVSEWSCETIATIPRVPGSYPPVITGVALQPHGNQLAVVGDDHLISVFDLPSGALTNQLDRHRDWVRVARFSPDGNWLATGGNDRQALLWNPQSWQVPGVLAKHNEAIADLAFSPDSQSVAIVGFHSVVRLYAVATRALIAEYAAPCADLHAVSFSADGSLICCAGRSGVIRGIDIGSGQVAWDVAAHSARVRSLSVNPANQLVSCGDDQLVRVCSVNQPQRALLEQRMASKQYSSIWIDEQTFATSGADNTIVIWNLVTGQKLSVLRGHTGTVSCLDYRDGYLISGSFDTHIRIWQRLGHVHREMRHLRQADGWSQQLK